MNTAVLRRRSWIRRGAFLLTRRKVRAADYAAQLKTMARATSGNHFNSARRPAQRPQPITRRRQPQLSRGDPGHLRRIFQRQGNLNLADRRRDPLREQGDGAGVMSFVCVSVKLFVGFWRNHQDGQQENSRRQKSRQCSWQNTGHQPTMLGPTFHSGRWLSRISAESRDRARAGHKQRDVSLASRHRWGVVEFLIRIALSWVALLIGNPSDSTVAHSAGMSFGSTAGSPIVADGATARPSAVPDATKSEPPEAPSSLFGNFLRLGVRHILTGYDHLLFLLGLLLVCVRLRAVVVIISCFTLAHTMTLIVSTLDLLTVPDGLVEPLIAVTIMGVGLENLWRRDELKRRAFFAFAFGLIHGFAFAGVLRSLLAGQAGSGLFLPLFSFNLGVELGQIALALVVVPLLWWLRRSPRFERYGIPGLSVLVALAGFYWLMERTVFS